MQCKNCQEELTGKQQFCSNCGQKNISKLNLKYILSQFIEDVFNVDSKVFQTIKLLSFKPGFLTKQYLDGKRASFIPPVRLYIVISVFFFFFISMVDFNNSPSASASFGEPSNTNDSTLVDGVAFTIDSVNVIIPTTELKRMQYEGDLEEGLDSLTAEMPGFAGYVSRKVAVAKIKGDSFVDILIDQFSLFLLLFLPFFSLLYATVLSRNKKGFVGHLIFNLHLNSFVMFSLIIHILMDAIFGGNQIFDVILFGSIAIYGQYYIIKAIMTFYERKLWVALYKYFLLIFGYIVLALVFIIFVFASSIFLV